MTGPINDPSVADPTPEPAAHREHCEHCEQHTTRISELESQIAALAPTSAVVPDDGDTNPDTKPTGLPWTHRGGTK